MCVNKCEYAWVLNDGGLRERERESVRVCACVRERERETVE